MNPKDLKEKIKAALKAAQAICDAAEGAARDFTADERSQVETHLKEARELKDQLRKAEDELKLKHDIIALGEGLEIGVSGDGQRMPAAAPGRGKTFGQQFAESEAWKNFLAVNAVNGVIPESRKGITSPPVEMKHLFKTLVTGASDTSAGAFVETDYTGIYEPLGRRPRTLLDLIPRGTTTSDTVEFVRQTAKVTEAAVTAEANVTTYSGTTGQVSGEKPEGAMTFEQVTETVKTIAVWIPATKRALSDAGQLRSLIDLELREDVQENLEDEIYDGAGGSTHFTGILNTSGILTQAWDTDVLTTCRKAKTYVRTTGRSTPTAFVMNPADWETIELLKDGNDRFYGNGPFGDTAPRLWGLPVVESEAVAEGTAILADWRKARIWDREQATISVSDSHSDFFIRNMVAILCELRCAFGLIRPSAFCQVELTAGT